MLKIIVFITLISSFNYGFAKDINHYLCSNLVNNILINSKELRAHTACTVEQLKKGLMNIKTLPEDSGMLFIFNDEQYLSFWAKSTYIPVDIAFLNNNLEIVDINSLKPLDPSIIRSSIPASYALEVNAGWFYKNGISVGDKIVISQKRY